MRKVLRFALLASVISLVSMPVAASAKATVEITSPKDGATVTGPKVTIKVKTDGIKLVDGGTPVKEGEGHVHLFINRDPSKAGEAIPTTEPDIVHFGKAPYDERTIDLQPGTYKLTALLGDSNHKALSDSPSKAANITVRAGDGAPTKPANTGDGSLAGGGVGTGALIALGLAAAALVTRRLART